MGGRKALLVTRVSGFIPQHRMGDIKILQEMGFEVHYATDLNNVVYGTDNRRLDGTGVITHQIDFCRSPFSRKVRIAEKQLQRLMSEEKFDLVHCHMPMSGVVARRAAHRVRKMDGRQVPVLYTAHGFHFCRGVPLKNWLYYPVERFYARYTDELIVLNDEDYRRACRFPVRGRVAKICGVGIDIQKISPYRKECWRTGNRTGQADVRKKYHLPEHSAVLVTVGELAPEKNHLAAIEAVAMLRHLDISYLICGMGRMEEKLRERVRELHLEDRVCFAGYVENVPAVLQQCDCFLFPSMREGLPVAVMEAMAVGLPVIAADIRGCRDLLGKAEHGCLCRKNRAAEYAAEIEKIFDAKDGERRRRERGSWNRQMIEKHFSLERSDAQMRAVYSEVLKR